MEEITLKWFLEVPGLFIVGGVLLMILAIIILVTGSRKDKSKGENSTNIKDEVVEISPIKVEENLNENSQLNSLNNVSNTLVAEKIPDVVIPTTPVAAATVITPAATITPVSSQPVVNSVVENTVSAPTLETPVIAPIAKPLVQETPIIVEPVSVPVTEPIVSQPNLNPTINNMDLNNVQMIMPTNIEEEEEII